MKLMIILRFYKRYYNLSLKKNYTMILHQTFPLFDRHCGQISYIELGIGNNAIYKQKVYLMIILLIVFFTVPTNRIKIEL